MSETGQNKWQILEERAMRLLSNPESLVENDKARLLLRLWQYPAFERYKVWAVYVQIGNESNFLLQKIVWNRPGDSRRLSDPLIGLKQGFHTNPNVSDKVKDVEVHVIKPCLDELLQINAPVFVARNNFGLDGVRFGFEFRKFTAKASYSWWCEAPDEWRMLEEWFLKTKNFLDTQFNQIS